MRKSAIALATVIFLLFANFRLQAQIRLIFRDQFPDSARARVGMDANYDINSNALTSKFIAKFYNSGYIDNDLKNSVLERTKNQNRAGANLNYSLFAAFTPDSIFHKKNISVFFSLRDREHFDCSYSKDLYKVGFYGNSSYAGKAADFNNFGLSLLRYQQLEIGLFSSKVDSAARWGIGLSFLKGEDYMAIAAKKAELYTSEDGQYIDFNTSMEAASSDTAHKGLGAFNGFGASVDIYFEAPFKTRFGPSMIRASVSDIGLIHFNPGSLYFHQDSVFHYTGLNVTSIYQLKDSAFASQTKDSVVNTLAPLHHQSLSVTIPATLNLTFETKFSRYFTMTEGIRYMFNANYKLLAYLKGDIYINKNLMLTASFGHGGYGNFSYGLGVLADFGGGYLLYAGSNNLEGFIAPAKTCGQSGYITIVKNFN